MGAKEGELNDQLQRAWSDRGGRLLRNNSGTAFYKNGDVVKFGVGNPGGSDLIGFTQVVITPDMVGTTVAVFTAVEAKTGKLKPTKDQENFLAMVERKGGIAIWGRDLAGILGKALNWMPRRL
jgi:hypothetical protein